LAHAWFAQATQNAIQLGQDIIEGTTAATSSMRTSVEAERYLQALVAVSPSANEATESTVEEDRDSVLSIDSLMFHAQHAASGASW